MALFYPESRFGGYTHADGTVQFYARAQSLLSPSDVCLDIGCGRGAQAEDSNRLRRSLLTFKGKCRKVIGVDIDPAGARNPLLDEFRLIDGLQWPVDDETIDFAVSDFTLEHVGDVERYFSEIERVLKRGGHLCLRTTNSWGYVALAAKLISTRHHSRVLRMAQPDRQMQDVFPATYRCNSVPKLRAMLNRHGFDAVVCGVESEPTYLHFSKAAYAIGVVLQKITPPWFRNCLLVYARKR